MSNYHPKFVEIMEKLAAMSDEEKINDPKAGILMAEPMRYAPPEMRI